MNEELRCDMIEYLEDIGMETDDAQRLLDALGGRSRESGIGKERDCWREKGERGITLIRIACMRMNGIGDVNRAS